MLASIITIFMPSLLNSEQRILFNDIVAKLVEKLPIPGSDWLPLFNELSKKIKQERAFKFLESLQVFFDQSAGRHKYHFDLLTDEDFVDIFEGVIKRVVNTRSTQKIGRFRNILINQLSASADIDLLNFYLDITYSLHEKQFCILAEHGKLAKEMEGIRPLEVNNTLNIQVNEERDLQHKGLPNKYSEMRAKLDMFLEKRKGKYYDLDDSTYQFFIQDLVSKSLLADTAIGGIGVEPYQVVEITGFGKAYLDFIEEPVAGTFC